MSSVLENTVSTLLRVGSLVPSTAMAEWHSITFIQRKDGQDTKIYAQGRPLQCFHHCKWWKSSMSICRWFKAVHST